MEATLNIDFNEKKFVKSCSIFLTSIYLLLFFPLLGGILCISLIAYEELTFWLGISHIVLFFGIVLSLPLSIFFMWFYYRKDNYKKVRFSWALPFLMTSFEMILEMIARSLFQY